MIGSIALLPIAALLASAGTPAVDGDAAGRALGRCMAAKTTGADRIVVARWLIAALASAPQVADLAAVPAAKKGAADRAMAQVFTRLVTVDCVGEARAAFAARGGSADAFRIAGEALGRVAMTELMSDAATVAALSAYAANLDDAAFAPVLPKR